MDLFLDRSVAGLGRRDALVSVDDTEGEALVGLRLATPAVYGKQDKREQDPVDPRPPPTDPTVTAATMPAEDADKAALVAYADERGIEYPKRATNRQIHQAIRARCSDCGD